MMVQGRVSYVSSTQNIFVIGGMIEMTGWSMFRVGVLKLCFQ